MTTYAYNEDAPDKVVAAAFRSALSELVIHYQNLRERGYEVLLNQYDEDGRIVDTLTADISKQVEL